MKKAIKKKKKATLVQTSQARLRGHTGHQGVRAKEPDSEARGPREEGLGSRTVLMGP